MFMKEQSENRRVRMTKRLMKDALLELLEQTELSGISVTAVCEKADVNRSTFYHYYNSPSDLLREIEQEVLDRIPALPVPVNQQGEENLLRATTAFFDYVKENEKVFHILFSESANAGFTSRMVDLLCAQHIPGVENVDELTSAFMQRYVANGTVGMLREWIDKGFPVSSQEISEMMYYLSRKITG
jgi:AcrR family transcriptional regulator